MDWQGGAQKCQSALRVRSQRRRVHGEHQRLRHNRDGGSFPVVEAGNHLDPLFTPEPEPDTWRVLAVAMAATVLAITRRNLRRGRP